MKNKSYIFRKSINADDIRDFINKYKLSRSDLARFLNVSIKTINYWLSSNKEITGPVVALFTILNDNEDLLSYYELEKKEYPLRLFYMNNNNVSTVIDVDYINRKVKFRNYTENIVNRAFGVKDKISFEDYENFIKSRCFPDSRDKLKIELEKIDIPFYDPLMIIEKTQGRVADDDNWLMIERENDDRTK